MIKEIIYKIKWRYNRFYRNRTNSFDTFIKHPKLTANDYKNRIHNIEEGNLILTQHLQDNKPFLVSRFGSGELRCICNYLHFKKQNKRIFWHEQVKNEMYNFGGIFPQSGKMLKEFSKIYINAIKEIDTLGIWFNTGENSIIENYCPNAKLIPLVSIEPYIHDNPWSQYLKGKKVLVIHPFEETIKLQYSKRTQLFTNPKILPDFELVSLKAVMSIPGEKLPFKNWNYALEYMKNEIKNKDFDVAIIGAGPYGLPLGTFVKTIGKQAIHLGGATQIFFGIIGERWLQIDSIKELFNPNWVYPLETEKPLNYKKLEGGCYW